MFHIFGWQHEHQSNNSSVPNPLINPAYKRHYSRTKHERGSFQSILHKHQVIN